MKPYRLLLCLLCITLTAAGSTRAESLEQRYVAKLRQRGLYRLAEVYCQQRLADDSLDARQQVEIAIEWSLVAVAQAYNAEPLARENHWRTAARVLDPWTKVPDRPYQLLAELQAALNLSAESELAALELVGTSDDNAVEKVQTLLRKAIGMLRDAADEVQVRRQQIAMRRTTGEPELNDLELAGIERSIALALAKALRTQALTYPDGSPDRVNSMQQAAESLAKLSESSLVDSLTWQARVAWLESLAALGESDTALAALQKWREAGPPPAELDANVAAAEARLLAAAGQAAQALARLDASPYVVGRSPQVDLARLELLLHLPGDNEQAIDTLLAQIRRGHQPRYVRQAEAMVGQRFAGADASSSAMAQVHAAEHFFRAGQLTAAVEAYDQAAKQYRNQQQRNQAFAAERSAAAVVQKQGNYLDAASRFRRLSLGSVDRDDSAIDHRESLLCLAMVVRDATPNEREEALANYLAACREHLRHWPNGNTASEVRVWLARALASRRQWQAVLETLEASQPGMVTDEEAFVLLAVAYRSRIAELTEASARRQLAQQARARLQPFIIGSGDSIGWPAQWTDAQRTCALELARMTLDTDDIAYAENMLVASLKNNPRPSAEYVEQATPVLAMAYVLGGKTRSAIDLLRQSADGGVGTNSLEGLAERLTDELSTYALEATPRTTERAALGQLLLSVVELAGEGTAQWKLPADRYRAAAYAAIANQAEASKLYESLIAQLPKNGDLREEYAALLGSSTNNADREKALALWSQLERGSTRGGDRWHRARQARIDLLITLGRRQEAEKLKTLTRILSGGK